MQTLLIWKCLKFVVWERVNSLPHNPDFQGLGVKSLLKILMEKEKNADNQQFFSFSHIVFRAIKDKNYYSTFVICKCFQFGTVYNFVVW